MYDIQPITSTDLRPADAHGMEQEAWCSAAHFTPAYVNIVVVDRKV
jgi:hypothetical protein